VHVARITSYPRGDKYQVVSSCIVLLNIYSRRAMIRGSAFSHSRRNSSCFREVHTKPEKEVGKHALSSPYLQARDSAEKNRTICVSSIPQLYAPEPPTLNSHSLVPASKASISLISFIFLFRSPWSSFSFTRLNRAFRLTPSLLTIPRL